MNANGLAEVRELAGRPLWGASELVALRRLVPQMLAEIDAVSAVAADRRPIELAANLIRSANWDIESETPTAEELSVLCGLMRTAGVFIRNQYDKLKEATDAR